MDRPAPYRAVSLDLWFTTVYHDAADAARWDAEREEFLHRALLGADGTHPTVPAIRTAIAVEHEALRGEGRSAIATDPEQLISRYAARLGARVVPDLSVAAQAYSDLGIEANPPSVNPEVRELLAELRERGVRVVSVTNTARRETTWRRYLNDRVGLGFETIVTSCDLGSAKPAPILFREAARRLGVAPEELLHVGDRWELDVVGARAAGCGAALYRGLWSRYPPGLYGAEPPPPDDRWPEIPRLDRLRELLDLVAAAAPGPEA